MPPSSPRPVCGAAPDPPVGSPRPFQGTPAPREGGAELRAGAGPRPAPVTPSSCGVGVTGSSDNPSGEMPRLRRQGGETPIRGWGWHQTGVHRAPDRAGTRGLGTPLLRGDPWGPLALCHRPAARCVSRGWEGLGGPGFGDTQCHLSPAAPAHAEDTPAPPSTQKPQFPHFRVIFFFAEIPAFLGDPCAGKPLEEEKTQEQTSAPETWPQRALRGLPKMRCPHLGTAGLGFVGVWLTP